MIEKLNKLPWNKTVWRYMDLPKFLDLITTEKLFFANCSKLTDKYEGVLPQENIDQIARNLQKNSNVSEQKAKDVALKQADIVRSFKDFTLLNCWSMSREESYALWKVYLGNSNAGVAVKTNIKKLTQSIKSDEKIYMGEVKYTNFIKGEPHVTTVITRKSPFYKYEEELRLFIPNQIIFNEENRVAKHPNGMKISVDTKELIDEIFISPFAGNWFETVLRKTLEELNPKLLDKIKRSAIRDV